MVDGFIELLDNARCDTCRSKEPLQIISLEPAKAAFHRSRHLWQIRTAAPTGDRKRPQLASFDVGTRRNEVIDEHLYLPGGQVIDRGCGSPVGNMGHFSASGQLEQLSNQMRLCSLPRRREGDPSWIFFRIGGQVL